MRTPSGLAEHLRSVYNDGAWTDVSVRAVFASFTHVEASHRPIPGRHTAWEILLHLDAWHRAVSRRLTGEVVELSPEEDWPLPPEGTDERWLAALARLDAGFEELLQTVRALSEDDLFDTLQGGRRTAYETIIGIGEHDLYHAGQAVLLKRAGR